MVVPVNGHLFQCSCRLATVKKAGGLEELKEKVDRWMNP